MNVSNRSIYQIMIENNPESLKLLSGILHEEISAVMKGVIRVESLGQLSDESVGKRVTIKCESMVWRGIIIGVKLCDEIVAELRFESSLTLLSLITKPYIVREPSLSSLIRELLEPVNVYYEIKCRLDAMPDHEVMVYHHHGDHIGLLSRLCRQNSLYFLECHGDGGTELYISNHIVGKSHSITMDEHKISHDMNGNTVSYYKTRKIGLQLGDMIESGKMITAITHIFNESSAVHMGAVSEAGFQYSANITSESIQTYHNIRQRIEHRHAQGLYMAKVHSFESGEYRLQFTDDINGTVSKPVPCITPYGGEDYGIHWPIPKNSLVIYAMKSDQTDDPYILGTINQQMDDRRYELKTNNGQHLTFEDDLMHPSITLATNSDTYIKMNTLEQQASIQIMCASGGIDIQSQGSIQYKAVNNMLIDSGNEIICSADKSILFKSNTDTISLHAKNSISMNSQGDIGMNTEKSLHINADDRVYINSTGSQALYIKEGDLDIKLNQGQWTLNSERGITVSSSSGGISLSTENACIELLSNGDILMKGRNICLTADQIDAKGISTIYQS